MQQKDAGERYLQDNAKKEGVTVTPSGLQYRVLHKGTSDKSPASDSEVEVHYRGTLIDGTVFDSSYDRGESIAFFLNQVIAGWTEGLQLMSEGDKFELTIPYQLGYGERGHPGVIPKFAALIFEVELLKVY
jgi:FKBP-type peptidyl-prolyl cis-trans isomerase FklB